MSPYVHDLPGKPQETVDVTITLGRVGFAALTSGSVRCSEVWLTAQPDGKYALGIVTPYVPEDVGLAARAVEHDDREERFPG